MKKKSFLKNGLTSLASPVAFFSFDRFGAIQVY
jgi:hypothetical protein